MVAFVLSPKLEEKENFTLAYDTDMLLIALGLDPSSKGFLALGLAVDMCRSDLLKRCNLYKSVYIDVARMIQAGSPDAVDLLIRRQVDKAWKARKDFVIEILFGGLTAKPTPGKMVAALAAYLGPAE